LKILHWAFPFTLGKGGQSVFIERIALEFSRLGHTTGILTSQASPDEAASIEKHFEHLVNLSQLPSIEIASGANQKIPSYSKLKHHIDVFAPDVIHLHNLESPLVLYLRSYMNLSLKKPKVIITVHDLSTLRKLNKLAQTVQLQYFFDAIIFPSKYIQESFTSYEIREKPIFRTIYNGVPKRPESLTRGFNHPQLLFAADLQEHKGGMVLLSAWEKIFHEFPEVTLKIAGDGPIRNFLEQLANSMQFKEQVRFYGWLSQDQLNQEFSKDCVLVIPSLVGEAFGLIGAEASMAGVPIIAHRIGALTEIVENGLNGFTVTTGDTDELAARMRDLLLNIELRRSMGEAGRKRATINFELSESVKSYEDLCFLITGSNSN
jgi:glycosyltransferase involved in cell wall biosynthesis